MAFLKPWFFLGPGGHDPGLAYLVRFPQRLSEILVRCEASCLDGFCGPGDPSGRRVVGTPFVETCQLTAGWFCFGLFVSYSYLFGLLFRLLLETVTPMKFNVFTCTPQFHLSVDTLMGTLM